MNRLAFAGPLACIAFSTAACLPPRVNENHCANQDGNAWCARTHPDEDKHYCGIVSKKKSCGLEIALDGCYAEPPPDECYAPCGCGEGSDTLAGECDNYLDGNTECLDVAGSSSSGEPSTGDGSTSDGSDSTGDSEDTTTGIPSCSDHPDCTDPGAPLCEPASQSCVPCDEFGNEADAACASKSDAAPVCAAVGCVACTDENIGACADTTPICDAATNSCGPCVAHAQCEASEACHIAEGSCFPETVVHVGPGETYATIGEALDEVQDDAVVIILHELAGGNEYAAVTIDDGRTIAIFAADGDDPELRGNAGPGLTLSAASTVYLRGITITDSSAQGILASGQAIAYLEDVTVDGNDAVGIQASNATLVVARSRITSNQQGGISISNNSNLSLVNSFVGGNISDVDVVAVANSDATIVYSTLGAGTNFEDSAQALVCDAGSDVTVRNSILVAANDDAEVQCTAAIVDRSAIETAISGQTSNTVVGNLVPGWFLGYAAGNFALSTDGANVFEGVARWRTGDPPTDIDGTERPTEDDTPDYAGADRPN